MADDFYTDIRDEDLYDEAHTTQAMSTYDITRMSQFSQVTTKIPPSFDGKASWLAYEDAIDDWCDITELDDEKRGPALRNRLEGDAAIYKKILDRDALKSKEEGVTYFKRTLRPFFVKGSVNVFLYRFQQFMNLRRGSSDLMKWMSRFQIQLKRLEEAWGDTLTPINDPANDEVRQYTQSLSSEVRQAMTAAQILTAVNERRRQAHMEKVPLTKNLIGLLFVSRAELSFDHRMSLTSIMAHRGIDLVGLDAGTLGDIFIEMFCNPRTAVDNPLLNNTGHGGRRSFIVMDEGELDGSFGCWAEDDDDGAEGFLDAHEDIFYIYDEQNDSWFQRRFQGRRSRKGKGKGRGGKSRGRGRGGRRFFTSRRKKKGHYQEDHSQSDDWSWQTEEAWWWQDGWSSQPDAADSWQSWDQESAHEHADTYKSKGKGKKGKKGKDGKDKKGSSHVASSQPEAQATVDVPSLPSSFFAMHHVGSLTAVGESELTGAAFGGPVNAGGPADGGPANAGEPDVVPDADVDRNEPDDDAAQFLDVEEEAPSEGGSFTNEEPGTPWGSLHTQCRTTDSEVDFGFDVYVPDLDSDDSEYGSYLYASSSMPPVENLTPGASSSGMNLNVSHFLNEESMSEPRILIYHEWLLAHEWHYCHCISDRVWCILQDFIRSLHGPSFAIIPGEGSGANSAFLQWTIWGFFEENRGDWGPIVRTLPLDPTERLHFLMTGILPRPSLIYFAAVVWREPHFIGWQYGMGRFVGELISRSILWKETQDFLFTQTLPLQYYKMLKRLLLEEREEAYLWVIYQANYPNAGLCLPPEGKEHYFPNFMYDKLGTKPLARVVVCYVPRRSSQSPEGLCVYPWPPVSDTCWHYHSSSIGFVYPNCFDENFDEWSNIDDDNIGSPPPNSQPYRNLGLSPIVLQSIFLLRILLLESLPCIIPLLLGNLALQHALGCGLMSLGMILASLGFITYFPIIMMLVGVRAVCGIEQKERQRVRHTFSNLAPNHRECGLPGLVSQCMLPTSMVRYALSIAILTVDLLPFFLLVLRRNMQLLPNSLRKNL